MEAAGGARERDEAESESESSSPPPNKKALDAYNKWLRKYEQKKKTEPEPGWEDYLAVRAAGFKDEWNNLWADKYGCFEDETTIAPSRFARGNPEERVLSTAETLQIFRVKIARIKGHLRWPLRVYGFVAARDSLDHNRNIIFRRPSEDCQIVTEGFPYLNLTGPKRAIVLLDPMVLEVDLKVKASNTSTPEEDYHLCSLAVPIKAQMMLHSYLVNGDHYSNKLSTLELTYGHIYWSVEATIDVRVVHGEWPAASSGRFGARTKSIENVDVVLLDFEYGQVCADADGSIKLSRSVVSVERTGLLLIDVRAYDDRGATVADSTEELTPKQYSTSRYKVQVGSYCEIQVNIAWSLFTRYP